MRILFRGGPLEILGGGGRGDNSKKKIPSREIFPKKNSCKKFTIQKKNSCKQSKVINQTENQ